MKRFFTVLAVMVTLSTLAAAQALPAGTGVHIKLETAISTETSKVGTVFSGRVTEGVVVAGKTLIPVGATIQGYVTKLTNPRRVRGTPEIRLRPDRLTMPDGEQFTITAVVVDTDPSTNTTVNDEGRIHGPGRTGKETAEIAVGTGAGTTIGAISGGGKGAFIGGALGATVTVAHWLTKRHAAELPAGSEIVLELTRPVTMSTVTAGQ